MWCIQATVVCTTPDGWCGMVPVPTFYLLESVQGITNADHAERIARDVVLSGPVPVGSRCEVNLTAVRVCDEPDYPI